MWCRKDTLAKPVQQKQYSEVKKHDSIYIWTLHTQKTPQEILQMYGSQNLIEHSCLKGRCGSVLECM